MFLVSEQRFNEITQSALSWLRNVLNRSNEVGRTYLLDLNEADLNRVRRIAGHPTTASCGGVWEAPEDSLHHILTAAVESIGEPMWGCWLDPAQQELVRENGQPSLEVFTVLDAKFAEHLDLTAPTDAAGTVLVVWWPLHSWRLPPFEGEHIETESEAANRNERDRIRRPPEPRPRPHTR
ncbi:hypothetical protein UG54_00745 [Gordonia sihwensis]|nr:hypothetical protein UG54_00745 [Gordonia sihwensis]